ncbi:MAG: hypothetical protein IJK18_07505 [Clostridia bacterium]|nr:hypothetical protein [Clostridia bacterium]
MTKIIKEMIIMLLVALASMLLFAVIFYEYIPNRKVVPEVLQYSASEKIKELKADNIDQRNEQVIKTFEVTSSDLSNYKVTNDYVAGKSDPFDPTKQSPDASSSTKKPGSEDNSNSSTTENTSTDTDTKSTDTNSSNKTTKSEEVVTTK